MMRRYAAQSSEMSLCGKVALVTGASGDIGRAIAFALLEAKSEVFMLARNISGVSVPPSSEGLQECCRYLAADLTDAGAVARAAEEIFQRGRLDILVLSSGIYARSVDPDLLAQQMAANVIGPYALLRRVLPLLTDAHGQVVFINSSQGLKASAEAGQFAATQHAMKALADGLRDEVNAKGVRIVSIYLGRTATSRQRAIFAAERRPYTPELLIQPNDVASVVCFMLQLAPTSEITDISVRPMRKT